MRQRRSSHRPVRKQEKRPRMNDQIRAEEVMLIQEDEGAKRMTLAEAKALAVEQELDLIEVSGKHNPPIVKIADYGNYLYHLQKKEKKQKAGSKQSETKMLRFGFRTERHDLDRILERAREFLGEKHMVKFAVRLRGREFTNKQYAADKLRKLIAELADVAEVDQEVKAQGNQFIAVVRAKK